MRRGGEGRGEGSYSGVQFFFNGYYLYAEMLNIVQLNLACWLLVTKANRNIFVDI